MLYSSIKECPQLWVALWVGVRTSLTRAVDQTWPDSPLCVAVWYQHYAVCTNSCLLMEENDKPRMYLHNSYGCIVFLRSRKTASAVFLSSPETK